MSANSLTNQTLASMIVIDVVVETFTFVTIVTNMLILAAFAAEKKLRTYNNYYIINIAVADLLVGLYCMPILSTKVITRNWVLGEVFCNIYVGTQNALLGVSVLGLVAICIDRYLATFYPIEHYQRRRKRTALIVNALTWLIPFVFWLTVGSLWNFVESANGISFTALDCIPAYIRIYSATIGVTLVRTGLPFVLILFLYGRINYRIRNLDNTRVRNKNGWGGSGKEANDGVSTTCDETSNTARKPGVFRHCAAPATGSTNDDCSGTITKMSLSVHTSPSRYSSAQTLQEDIDEAHTNATQSTLFAGAETPRIDQLSRRDRSQHDMPGGCMDDIVMDEAGIEQLSSSPSEGEKKMVRRHGHKGIAADHINANGYGTGNKKKESAGEKRRASRTLTLIVAAFLIAWLPFELMTLTFAVMAQVHGKNIFPTIPYLVRLSVRWLTFANSLLNPIAYAVAQPLIRQTLVRILRPRCFQNP